MTSKRKDTLSVRLMNIIGLQLLDFAKTKINALVEWDLIAFFNRNPNIADSVENIAKYTGRSAVIVRPILEELVENGVMEKREAEGIIVYSLAANKQMHQSGKLLQPDLPRLLLPS